MIVYVVAAETVYMSLSLDCHLPALFFINHDLDYSLHSGVICPHTRTNTIWNEATGPAHRGQNRSDPVDAGWKSVTWWENRLAVSRLACAGSLSSNSRISRPVQLQWPTQPWEILFLINTPPPPFLWIPSALYCRFSIPSYLLAMLQCTFIAAISAGWGLVKVFSSTGDRVLGSDVCEWVVTCWFSSVKDVSSAGGSGPAGLLECGTALLSLPMHLCVPWTQWWHWCQVRTLYNKFKVYWCT